jgi:hypothetical protein
MEGFCGIGTAKASEGDREDGEGGWLEEEKEEEMMSYRSK